MGYFRAEFVAHRRWLSERAYADIVALSQFLPGPGSSQTGFAIGLLRGGGWGGLAAWAGFTLPSAVPVSRGTAIVCLTGFVGLLAASYIPAGGSLALWDAFYRSGALVFGGGHVVLPLLRDAVVVPGWVSDGSFLAGYGTTQAMPGPVFTFAAYLGAVSSVGPGGVPGGVLGSALALIAIFVPGILALVDTLPCWHAVRGRPDAQPTRCGINAAVVGILAAALYQPA